MWTISATVETTAKAEVIWNIYTDVANWPQWDKGMHSYQPNGPFATGTGGVLQPEGGPELPFTLLQVEEGRLFVDRTALGDDAAIIGRHILTSIANGTRITHIIEIEAPDAEGLATAFGFKQEELQETVNTLAQYAEEKEHD